MMNILITVLTFSLFLLTSVSAPALTRQDFQATEFSKDNPAETSDEAVSQLLKNKYRIDFESGELRAEGADFLAREAAASQFFLIGETHGIAEVPLFTQALFRRIRAAGYKHLAVETGSLTARVLEELAGRDNAGQSFTAFDREYPFALPFYNMKEEAALLEIVLKNDKAVKERLWGLDYEFILSSKMHFKRLVELAPDKAARQTIESYYRQVSTEFERLMQNKNPGALFIISARKQDWEKLQAALRPKTGSEAWEILQALKTAQEIYLKKFVFGQDYESNYQRVELMKNQFMRYYNAAARREKLPKAILKFGAIHTKRGRSYENLYDIGSLAAGLADSNGTKSFHLLILPVAGTINLYRPFAGNEADKIKVFEAEAFKPDESADIKPFLSLAANENEPFVVDLRPMRPMLGAKKFARIDRGFEEIVWGYDAVLVMPQVRASMLLN